MEVSHSNFEANRKKNGKIRWKENYEEAGKESGTVPH